MKLCINCKYHYQYLQYLTQEVKDKYPYTYKYNEVGDLLVNTHECHQRRSPVDGRIIIEPCNVMRSSYDLVSGHLCGPEGRFYEEK
jgi:hypothetical protein